MDSPPNDAVIEVRAASLGYQGTAVLENINLTIWRGDIVALLGGSGSGKTTLLQAMLGLITPLAGQILLFGRSVSLTKNAERARMFSRIGVVFQQNALFTDMTVADNLAVAARQRTALGEEVLRELVSLQLWAVGLPGLESRRPDQLSGGQRKRVAFARAIMLSPEILFCDEPTAGLDPVTSATLRDLIRELAAELGATLIFVTHDIELIQSIATRVVIIHDAKIHSDAPLVDLWESSDAIVTGLLGSHRSSQVLA